MMTTEATYWSVEHVRAAEAEGWRIGWMGDGFELQRIDEPAEGEPTFTDDVDVWVFVWHTDTTLHRYARAFLEEHAAAEYAIITRYLYVMKGAA
jgi:hypothetical protein